MSKRTQVTIYLDSDLKRRLKHFSIDKDMTMSEIVEGFIHSGMRRARIAPAPPHHPEPPPVPGTESGRG